MRCGIKAPLSPNADRSQARAGWAFIGIDANAVVMARRRKAALLHRRLLQCVSQNRAASRVNLGDSAQTTRGAIALKPAGSHRIFELVRTTNHQKRELVRLALGKILSRITSQFVASCVSHRTGLAAQPHLHGLAAGGGSFIGNSGD